MRMTGMPVSFAKRRRMAATSRICVTEPGVDSAVWVNIVWTESTIIRSGIISRAWTITFSMRVSLNMWQFEQSPPSRSARIFTWRALSSPVTYNVFREGQPRGIWSERVDFPMPGSPPMSTREPSTMPPPRIRSTSPLQREIRASEVESISASLRGRFPSPGTESLRT